MPHERGITEIMQSSYTLQLKYSSTKQFVGSKPSSFYSEDYFLNAQGSNYGRIDEKSKQFFLNYEEQNILPGNRVLANYLTKRYKPKTVMVLGCARAYLVKAFQELGVDCRGVDISEWAIQHAPAGLQDYLFVGDICDLSFFESNYFDVITAMDVFEHIAVPDLFAALDEVKRIANDVLILKLPISNDDQHPDQTNGDDKSHISVYSLAWWHHQLEQRGFTLENQRVDYYPHETSATIIFRKQKNITDCTT